MDISDIYIHMIKLMDLINEVFDTASLLLLNPLYDNKSFDELLRDFKADGGHILGSGRFGTVLSHPSWKYVLKIFTQDVPYLKYVRFVLQNPRPSFPKFYDKPRRIRPHYKRSRSNEFIYIVLTEKLKPVSYEEYSDIKYYLYYGGDMTHANKLAKTMNVWKKIIERVEDIEDRHPDIKHLKEDYNFLMAAQLGSDDMGKDNVMKRSNGQFVLSDPVWEGETPYQTYDRMMRSEMDDYDYDKPPSAQLTGGQRYKKPKVKPIKITKQEPDDGVPFQ